MLPPRLYGRNIYLRDAADGIMVYPRSDDYPAQAAGDQVHVTGWTRQYHGEVELSVPNSPLRCELPTYPQPLRRRGGSLFDYQMVPFSVIQGTGPRSEVVPFWTIKWFPFHLTNTSLSHGDVLTVDGNLVQAQVVRFRQNQLRNARSRDRCMVDSVGRRANRLPDSRPLVISREVRENPFSTINSTLALT
jgi:hypothetical protein